MNVVFKWRGVWFLLAMCSLVSVKASTRVADQISFLNKNAKRYLVKPKNATFSEMRRLTQWLSQNEFDISGVNFRKKTVEIVGTSPQMDMLTSRGLEVQELPPANPDPRFLNPETLTAKLKQINARFPAQTKLIEIGKTLQGRPVWAMLVTQSAGVKGFRARQELMKKPSLLVEGLHHAREVMTPEVVVDIAETLLTQARFNSKARAILEQWQVWIVPMLNMDGSNIVFNQYNMWRKNARGDQRSGIYGVDLNRNYTYRWGNCDGSSGNKSSEIYRGASAGSEPEAQAFMKLANAIRPTALLSYHSFGEMIIYSFACNGSYTGENNFLKKVGKELSDLLPTDDGKGKYAYGTVWELLYGVDGDSSDYVFANFGSLSMSFEINEAFQPKYEMREPTLKKHRNAWSHFIQRASQNLLTLEVKEKTSGKPLKAVITIDTIKHTQGEKPFQTNEGGYYFKVLDLGTHTVKVQLEDGKSQVIEVNMNGKPQTFPVLF